MSSPGSGQGKGKARQGKARQARQGAVTDWARILAYVTRTVDQELLARNEYLAAQNRIMKAQLNGRLKLSDVERGALGKKHRDASYGHAPPGISQPWAHRPVISVALINSVGALQICLREHPIAQRSPWQNGHAERLIGSIRRECLDHIVVFGEAYVRRILAGYAGYYNELRTHLSLNKDRPGYRSVQRFGHFDARPILGGLVTNTAGNRFR